MHWCSILPGWFLGWLVILRISVVFQEGWFRPQAHLEYSSDNTSHPTPAGRHKGGVARFSAQADIRCCVGFDPLPPLLGALVCVSAPVRLKHNYSGDI